MSKIAFGVKIYLDDTYIANNSMSAELSASIGIYEVSGDNDQIRWSTDLVPHIVDAYTVGPILKGSVSPVDTKTDLRRSGNVNQWGGVSFDIDNTVLMWKILEDNGIYLEGLAAELIEFDLTSETELTIFRGIMSASSYTVSDYKLRINTSLDKRNANIATVISNEVYPDAGDEPTGTTLPVSYGDNPRSAFIRTNKENKIIDLTVLGSNLAPNDQKSMPLVEYIGDTVYIMTGVTTTLADTAAFVAALGIDLTENHYMFVFSGRGQGQYRKIESIEWRPDRVPNNFSASYPDFVNYRDYPILKLELDNYIDEDLRGTWYANADDNSWIQLVEVSLAFDGETAATAGFTDAEGNIIEDEITIYNSETDLRIDYNPVTGELYDRVLQGDTRYVPLPSYGVVVDTTSDNKRITIDPRYIEKDVSTIVNYANISLTPSFVNVPPSELVRWCDLSSDDDLDFREYLLGDGLTKSSPGVYTRSGRGNTAGTPVYQPYTSVNHAPTAADLALLSDKKWSTRLYWNYTQGLPGGVGGTDREVYAVHAIEFDVPYETLEQLDYESLHFSFAADAYTTETTFYSAGTPGASKRIGDILLVVRGRSFWGGLNRIYEDPGQSMESRQGDNYYNMVDSKPAKWCSNNSSYNSGWTGGVFNNYLDEYWIDGDIPQGVIHRTKNRDFYDDVPIFINSGASGIRSGVKSFEIPGSKEDHLSLRKLGLFFIVKVGSGPGSPLPFDLNIRQCSLMARATTRLNPIIYFPFKGRVDGSSRLIDNPIALLEDICYRQNWSELNGTPPAKGWGQGRSSSVLIKNDNEHGAFNFTGYAYERNLKLRSTITLDSEAYTEKLKKKICGQFFLTSYQDNAGQECVDSIVNPLSEYKDDYPVITLNEIVGTVGAISSTDYKDIFCQPTIYYDFNTALGTYDKNMGVTNVDKDTFSVDYVNGTGIGPDLKEAIWTLAHRLYKKYRIINEAPKIMTELDLIYRDEEAGYFLYSWLYWQSRNRVNFKLPYALAKDWHISKRFVLRLPHQTADIEHICLVESINKGIPTSDRDATVSVSAVIYSLDDDNQYFIQDVYRPPTDWQDTMSSTDPDIQNTLP